VLNQMDQSNALVGQEAMPENNKPEGQVSENAVPMETLLEQEGLNLDFPKQGEIRTGVIASISDNEILVSVGTKSEGVIAGREKDQIPPEEFQSLKVGQEIPVFILNPEDQNGNLVLSYVRAREEYDWQNVEAMLISGDVTQSKVVGYNKGGLIVPVGNLRGFVPASQISVLRRPEPGNESPEARWASMVGDPISVRVIEVDRQRHRLILSERSALQETRETIKDRLLDELQEGAVRTGRVTSLADFGAFVNIDGADGLVHLSEISWERIGHPNEVLKVGQEVQVKVIAIDRDRKRIGLSIRQMLPDPWVQKVAHIKEGQLVEGTITHLTKFGAFARLGEEMEGLIHISELSESRINHPKEVIKEGDVLTLRVIKIDAERRRIGLSLRKVDSPAYADLDWKMELSGEVGETHLSVEASEPAEEETQLPSETPEPAEGEIQLPSETPQPAEGETQLPSETPEPAEGEEQES
jgi:small subunit ribosomal protein S1